MSGTAEKMRAWTGPAILTYGFRPFFLGGALWAAIAMALWIPMQTGLFVLPTAFDPVSWHAHEFLYGYLAAVVAGFLLTAVPNWTGRLPVVGLPLGGLFTLWLVGRMTMALSAGLPPLAVALVDLSMPLALAGVLAREIVAGRNWRNLIVLGMLAVMVAGNAMFHWEAARGDYAAQGYGLRLGLAAAMMMIAVIGGRIVPSFTRNWLVRRGGGRLPAPPMQRFDKLAILILVVALVFWVLWPAATATAVALLLVGLLHLVRLARWAGHRTFSEPLVWVLHAGYAFLPLGALTIAGEILTPGLQAAAAAQHLWMAGAIGLMTLAVMTRATLGHSGQALAAGKGTVGLYLALVAAVMARLGAGVFPEQAAWLHGLSGLFWLAAFAGFAALYGPLLLRPKPKR